MAKTLRSRIAAVAVVALGFGTVQAMPAFAASSNTGVEAIAAAKLTVGDLTLARPVATGGRAVVVTDLTVLADGADGIGVGGSDEAYFKATFVGGIPGGGSAPTITAVAGTEAPTTANIAMAASGATNTVTATAAIATDTVYGSAQYYFDPTVAGSYTLMVWADQDSNGALNGSEPYKTISVVVGDNLASVKISQPVAGSIAVADGFAGTALASGGVLRVDALTSGGAAAGLKNTESLLVEITNSTTAKIKYVNGGSALSPTVSSYNLSRTNFDDAGSAYLNIVDTVAENVTVKVTLVGSTTVTSSTTMTFVKETALAVDINTGGTAGLETKATTGIKAGTGANYLVSTGATSFSFVVGSATASAKVAVTLTDDNGRVFGTALNNIAVTGLAQDMIYTVGSSDDADISGTQYTASVSVSPTYKIANGAQFSLASALATNTATTQTVAGQTATNTSWSIKPATTFQVADGGSITVTATLKDQFGIARPNVAVSYQVTAGRNKQLSATNSVTDASGVISVTVTDTATTKTLTSDTLTLTASGVSSGNTVTLNYVSALTAGSLTASNKTSSSPLAATIRTSDASAYKGSVAITATALDAAGNPLAGLPVTITVPTDAALDTVTTTSPTQYTNASGVASFNVYSTKVGTYAFTYSGGGLTATSYVKFSAGSARVVSVTTAKATAAASEQVAVTIKVADAYGNGVSGASVTVSATGAGAFVGAPLSSTQTTDINGNVTLAFSSAVAGTGKITATLDTATYTQAGDGAALVGTTAAAGFPAGVASASASIVVSGPDTAAIDAIKAQVAALGTTITSIQTAISTLVASTTATLTLIQAQIGKIMKKLKI